jgi:drug/metabolite transporter (DMT)-like permease
MTPAREEGPLRRFRVFPNPLSPPTVPPPVTSGSPKRQDPPERGADLALVSVVLIWGVNIPVMKAAVGEMHPYAFNAVRLILSAALLGVMDRLEARRGGTRPGVPWGRVSLVALLGSLLYQLVFIVGIRGTRAGNAALIVATGPIWTAIIAWACAIERISANAWRGLAIAFAGTALVACEGGDVDLAGAYLGGNLLVLVSALSWGGATVLSKPLVGVLSPTRLAFWMTALTVPLHVLIGLPYLGPVFAGEPRAWAWWCVLFSGLLSTGLAYSLWNSGVRRVGPSHTAIYTNLVPVIALAVSWTFLGETMTASQVAGGALIVGGLVVMRRGRPWSR